MFNFLCAKEREREELSISEVNRNIDAIFDTSFEKYRYIKGFKGIWSKDLKCIECEIETGLPFYLPGIYYRSLTNYLLKIG